MLLLIKFSKCAHFHDCRVCAWHDSTNCVLCFSVFQIGAFFMINLCLVVIATQFSETKKRETERMLQERKRYHSSSTLASNSEPGGCYDEIIKYIAHLWRRARRKLNRMLKRTQGGRRQRKVTPEKAISLKRKHRKKTLPAHHHYHHHHHHPALLPPHHSPEMITTAANHVVGGCSPLAPRASPELSDIDPLSSPRRPNFLSVPPGDEHDSSPPPSTGPTPRGSVSSAIMPPPADLNKLHPHIDYKGVYLCSYSIMS